MLRGLILSAGLGKRMGPLGERCPKPLWRFFEKTLLEAQISFMKEIGIDKIFINVYHQKKHFSFLNDLKGVEVVVEETLLDTGGAIHNIAKRKEISYSGPLLVMNSDVFLMLNELDIKKMLLNSKEGFSTLCLKKVLKTEGYNQVKVENNLFKGIVPHNETREEEFFTYTGFSCISLDSLTPSEGESRFFDTVCVEKAKKVFGLDFSAREFWDFGSLDEYFSSLLKLVKEKESTFLNFLVRNKLLEIEKLARSRYGEFENFLDFSTLNYFWKVDCLYKEIKTNWE